MKKFIITATLISALGLASTSAIAEDGNRLENHMARMQQALGLTDEQAAQIKSLREAQRTAMQTSRESNRQQIEALLTPEQKEKFSTMKQRGHKRGHKMGKRGKRSGGERMQKRMDKRMTRMQEKLGLSDEQVAQIKSLREAQHTASQAARDSHRQQIEALLTPEQKEKFNAMKQKRGKRGGHKHHRGKKQQDTAA